MNKKIIENIVKMIGLQGNLDYSNTVCGSDFDYDNCDECERYNHCRVDFETRKLYIETLELLNKEE